MKCTHFAAFAAKRGTQYGCRAYEANLQIIVISQDQGVQAPVT